MVYRQININKYKVTKHLIFNSILRSLNENSGTGALNGKMLLVRIIKNNKINAYLRSDWVM